MTSRPRRALAALGASALLAAGCTTLREWVDNGFKVGPSFYPPPVDVSPAWIDAGDSHLNQQSAVNSQQSAVSNQPLNADSCSLMADNWWDVFHDDHLTWLIETAHRENLDLKTAGTRVLQAQAQYNIAIGNLFPQSQTAQASYVHAQISKNLKLFGAPQAGSLSFLNVWATGFNASWEIDFWGRVRRQIESADAQVGSNVESYRAALVSLLGDVATNYVQLRTFQQRIAYAQSNVAIQRESLRLAEARLAKGTATALDVKQARSSLAQIESSIPLLVLGMRQANDRLCLLIGESSRNLLPQLGEAPIPGTPPQVAVGVPAQLLERRPDVRRARLDAAAQCAQIGVAEADFYPQFGVTGFLGYAADDVRRLFEERSFTGVIFPSFSWKILNYGRITNNVRYQEARFQERLFQYQQSVLAAGREVEDALGAFLQYQLQAKSLEESVKESEDVVKLAQTQYESGLVDFNRVLTAQAQLVAQQDQIAAARGNIAVGLIAVYRALGGGWQFFESGEQAE